MSKILLVDDEQNILNALRRELHDHFEVETFADPVAALEHCRNTQFDLVIADYNMPEMDGLEFLKQLGRIQPDASRMLLSGHADIDTLIRTINETHVYRFIAKPWEKAELIASVEQALSYRDAILKNRLQANRRRPSAAAQEPPVFRIVLVESDAHLRTLMARSLTDENDHGSLYGAIQQELQQGASATKFQCTVESFENAHAALAHVEQNPCDLIVCAQSLSDMDGIQLLSKMRQIWPDVARILISSEPDKSMLSQAINEAAVQNLLHLHWDNYELRANARRQAWNLHQLKTATIQALAARELLRGVQH
ncbi:MAG TPA: response regulator [Sideroxyarcus sp.]|nr:response regulator [Sideroxyarcus sp.]